MLGGQRRAAAGRTDTKSRDKDTSLVNDSQSKGGHELRRLLVRVISPPTPFSFYSNYAINDYIP